VNHNDLNHSYFSLIILSLFSAGGLYAYGREALRLKRLLSSGNEAEATIRKKEKIDSGSESVVHFLVTYEFIDDQGNTVVHEQDLNSRKFFDSLDVGDKIEILYHRGQAEGSYPLSQIRNDRKIAHYIAVGILLLWGVMGVILI
jgi:hypothetical protein